MPLRRVAIQNELDPDATPSSLLRRLKNWDDQSGWQEFFDTYWKLIYVLKNLPLRRVSQILHVSATLVYVTKHRVNGLIRQEVRRLKREFNRQEEP